MIPLSLSLLLGLGFLAFSFLAAGHALLHKREPRSALGWVACCLLLPYVGPFIYLVFGINRTRLQARRRRPYRTDADVTVSLPHRPGDEAFPLAGVGHRVTRKELLPSDGLSVLVNGDETYPRMLEAIGKARRSVYLATYIFANGRAADGFLDALEAAHRRGVDVRVLLDGMGEFMSFPRIGLQLKRRGIPFRRFNPFSLLPPSLHINMRNHRKILVVDGETGFTGGTNIADGNLHGDGARHCIQDLHFLLDGPLVTELEHVFVKDWDYCAGRIEAGPAVVPSVPRQTPGPETPWTRLVVDGPNENLDQLSDILGGVFSAARSRIWIMTPYFLPNAEMIGSLQSARLRGVEVKIVLPQANNIPVTHWAARHLLWQLLDYGVEVLYQKPPFSHTKVLLIDGYYCQVGSANFDTRSLRLNYELTVEIFSRSLHARLAGYFEERLEGAERCDRAMLDSRSLPARLRDAMCWLFTPYL